MSKIDDYRKAKEEHGALVNFLKEYQSDETTSGIEFQYGIEPRYYSHIALENGFKRGWCDMKLRGRNLLSQMIIDNFVEMCNKVIVKSAEMLEQSRKEAEDEAIAFIKGWRNENSNETS